MSSNAISGVGTKFMRWNGTSAWAAIAEVSEISGPAKSRDTMEVTTLDTVDGYREFIGSFRDGGSVPLKMNFTRTTYDLMNTDFESEDANYYQIVLPDSVHTTFEFRGFLTELGMAITTGDAISADVTIKVSGKVLVRSGMTSDSPSV